MLCLLYLFGGTAHAQTTVTGTTLTSDLQTPLAGGIVSSKVVGVKQVRGTVVAQACEINSRGECVRYREVTCGGALYTGPSVGYIGDDGQWFRADGTLGLPRVANAGCSPSGLATEFAITLNKSTSEPSRQSETTFRLVRVVPNQASVDFSALSPAVAATPAAAKQDQSRGDVLDSEGWTCVTPASVPTPAAGVIEIFCDSTNSNSLTRKNSDGSVTVIEGGGGGGGGDITAVGNCATGACFGSVSANQVFAGPTSGGAAAAAMRALVAADIPALDASKVSTGVFGDGQVSDLITLSNLTQITTRNYSDLQNIPATFAPSAHTHAAVDVNSGTLADARVDGSLESDEVTMGGALSGAANAAELVAGVAGAGIGLDTSSSPDRLETRSDETDFLRSGALICGAGTRGRMQVHTTPLQYCDNAATPALQYAAYGDSAGAALSGDSATAFFSTGTIEDARLSANVSLLGQTISGSEMVNDTVGPTQLDETANYTWTGIHSFAGATLAGGSPLIFEGATADAFETTFSITDPTADRTVNIPNADSTTVQAQTCSGTDKISAISAAGVITCSADQTGAGGGDAITVATVAAADPDFIDTATIDVTLATAPNPDTISWAIVNDSVGPTQIDETANYTWTGIHSFAGATLGGGSPLVLEGATADAFETTFSVTDPTADRTVNIPNADTVIPQAFSCTNQFARSLNGTTGATTCASVGDADVSGGDLGALAALASTGIMARTAADTYALRTLTAGDGTNITNGSGVSGNPTFQTVVPFVIPFLARGGFAWTDMPAAATEFAGSTHSRLRTDLTYANQVRIGVRMFGTTCNTGATLKAQYSTDESTWNDLSTTVACDATGSNISTWQSVPGGAIGSTIYIRIVGTGGNGTIDPQFDMIHVDFK